MKLRARWLVAGKMWRSDFDPAGRRRSAAACGLRLSEGHQSHLRAIVFVARRLRRSTAERPPWERGNQGISTRLTAKYFFNPIVLTVSHRVSAVRTKTAARGMFARSMRFSVVKILLHERPALKDHDSAIRGLVRIR